MDDVWIGTFVNVKSFFNFSLDRWHEAAQPWTVGICATSAERDTPRATGVLSLYIH